MFRCLPYGNQNLWNTTWDDAFHNFELGRAIGSNRPQESSKENADGNEYNQDGVFYDRKEGICVLI